MTYRELRGLRVSVLAAEATENRDHLDAAREAGVNLLVVEPSAWVAVGSWPAARRGRDTIVLAVRSTAHSRPAIQRALDAALRELGTDHVDLWCVRGSTRDDEETLRTLDDAVRAGKVRYLAACNTAVHRLVRGLWISDTRGLERYAALFAPYGVDSRELEREHVPACREHGLHIVASEPVVDAGGERATAVRGELERVARECGATPSEVAVAWLARRPGVSACLVPLAHVRGITLALDADQLHRLDEASAFHHGAVYDMIERVAATDVMPTAPPADR